MSYSARQQYCLEAMGMVPWVSTALPAEPFAAGQLLEEPLATAQQPAEVEEPNEEPLVAAQQPAEVPNEEPLVTAQQLTEVPIKVLAELPAKMPTELQALSAWLPHQALASFLASGKRRCVMGPDDASLVVLVESGSEVGQQPLEGDAARLFDMMMRAIKITRQQLRICAIAAEGARDERAADQPTLSDICNPQTKAVLLLVQRWDTSDDRATSHDDTVRLAAPPCPMWRIPHPDILLSRNQLKRQAWQSLQALQRVL